jgi:hypothetical protein
MYGINLEEGDPNPYGLGFAPQGGYTLDPGVFLGARFDYFLGGTEEVPFLGELSLNIYQILAEAGYDVEVGDSLVVRPKVGVGVAKGLGEACIDGACVDADGDMELAFSPGANLLYMLDPVFLNVDVRYNVITSDPSLSALMLGAGAGIAL